MPNQTAIDAINAKKADYIAAVDAAETAMLALRTALGNINAASIALYQLERAQVGYFDDMRSRPQIDARQNTIRTSQRIGRALDTMPNRIEAGWYGILSYPTEQPRIENWVADETTFINNATSWLLGKLAQ